LSGITRVTDRQTDRQTDRILIARPRLHFMQRGKKKKREMTNYTISVMQMIANRLVTCH